MDLTAPFLLKVILSSPPNALFLDFIFMLMSVCLHVCVYTMCGPDALGGGHEGASDSLELELRTLVSHHVGVGNQVPGLCKCSPASVPGQVSCAVSVPAGS